MVKQFEEKKSFKIPKEYIISCKSKFKTYWDKAVLLLAFYNSL